MNLGMEGYLFSGITELSSLLTTGEILKSLVILRRKHRNLVQKAPASGVLFVEAGWIRIGQGGHGYCWVMFVCVGALSLLGAVRTSADGNSCQLLLGK